ncbi:radical SAM protein [Shinella sp.]|uniref:radical SAM protein n=1 Tax=Shinella sp. TaxID=1870904 RepID=UPI0039B898AB
MGFPAEHKLLRPSLEFALTAHCNLRCAGCDHGSPHLRANFSSVEGFAADIEKLRAVMIVGELRLLGGEPLLHPQFSEFISVAKESGIADRVIVWTNGVFLHKVKPETFRLLDGVRVSTYPGVKLPLTRDEMVGLSRMYSFELNINHCGEFLECFNDVPHSSPAETQEIYNGCLNTGAWSCHSFADGTYYKCSRAAYIRDRIAHSSKDVAWASDGVALQGPDLLERLTFYLQRTDPILACRWCKGTSGQAFAHHQLPRGAGALARR